MEQSLTYISRCIEFTWQGLCSGGATELTSVSRAQELPYVRASSTQTQVVSIPTSLFLNS